MTKEELWQIYQEKNPAFKKDQVTLTQAGLYNLFSKTWDIAFYQGEETSYEDEPRYNPSTIEKDEILKFFPWAK